MPKPPEVGHVAFDPPLKLKTQPFDRAWEIIKELDIFKTTCFHYVGNHEIKGLTFETREQAMLFRLKF